MQQKSGNNKKKKSPRRINILFLICLTTSVALFIAGFFVPPMGVIDGSVLTAVGMLLGFGVIAMLPDMIESGHSAKLNLPGNTSVELKKSKTED